MITKIAEQTGAFLINAARVSGRWVLLFKDAMKVVPELFKKPKSLVSPLNMSLVKPILLVAAVSFLTGMVMSLQTGRELQRWGIESNIGAIVGTAMAREMGPLWAAVIVTAAVGSSFAAELGTMKVSEELDALEVMAIDPIAFLVMPRIIALVIAVPILSIYSDVIGFAGGGFIASSLISVPMSEYFDSAQRFLEIRDIWIGIFKAVLFGLSIGIISCQQGIDTKGGSEGVGTSTITTVVLSIIMILFINFLVSAIFFPGT